MSDQPRDQQPVVLSCRNLGKTFTPQQQAWWDETCRVLIARALAQHSVFVHRDYMPRNLMVSTPNPGVLDFQDAVYGPISYDVVSLFKDAFASWPAVVIVVMGERNVSAPSASRYQV